MALIDALRLKVPALRDLSDVDIAKLYAERTGVSLDQAATELEIQRNDPGFWSAVRNSTGGIVQGLGEVGRLVGYPNNALERYGEDVQFRNPMAIQSLGDIAQHPWEAVKEGVGMAVPFIAGQVATGGLGTAVEAAGAGLRAAPLLGRGLSLVGRAVANPWVGGTAIASAPALAQIGQAQRASGEVNIPAEIGGALATGLVEQLGGPQRIFFRATRPAGLIPFTPGGIAMRAVRVGAEEAGEEAVQQPIQQLASGQNPTSGPALENTAFNAAMGFIGGVPFGAGHGVYQRLHTHLPEPDIDAGFAQPSPTPTERIAAGEPVDLLNPARVLQVGNPIQAFPHASSGAMPAGTPVENRVTRAAGIIRAAAANPQAVAQNPQFRQDLAQAHQVLQAALTPAQYQQLLGPTESPARAPQTPSTFGAMFRAAGGRVTSVIRALDQARDRDEALAVVRGWLEKPNIATNTLHALEEVHNQLSGETHESYLRGQETKLASRSSALRARGLIDHPAFRGTSNADEPGSSLESRGTQPERPVPAASQPNARASETAKAIVGALSDRDRQVLELVQQHGMDFARIGQVLGVSRQAARDRLLGKKNADGTPVLDDKGRPKQLGILDRIANVAATQGVSMDDLLHAYRPRVYESDEARRGLPPQLNESKFEEEAKSQESPVAQGSGIVETPGGSQSATEEAAHEKELERAVPGYKEARAAEQQVQGEQEQEPTPRADEGGAQEDLAGWLASDNGESLTRLLSDRDQEFVAALKRHGGNFGAVAKELGVDRQTARQKFLGKRDKEGRLVIDGRPGAGGGPKQAGLLDRLGRLAADHQVGLEASAPRFVREAYEARLGVSPRRIVGEASEKRALEASHQVGQEASEPPGEQPRPLDPDYLLAAAEWNGARAASDNKESIPTFDALDELQHIQEYVIDQVKRHGRLPARDFYRALALFNEPTYYSKGRAFTDEELALLGVQRALRELRQSGLYRVLNRLHSVSIVEGQDSDGMFHFVVGRPSKITLSEELLKGDPRQLAHVIRHEVSHEIDFLGGYSQMPELAVSRYGDPVGEVARELEQLFLKGTEVGKYLSYPLDRDQHDDLGKLEMQAELFAQLQAAWMSDYGRAAIQREAPRAAAFLREVNEDAKEQLR